MIVGAAPDANVRACELHIWPGGDLRSTYHGWFHGGIVDGAAKGREGYRPLPNGPLPSDRQAARLQKLALADAMRLDGYRVVVHDAPLESRVIRTSRERYAPGTPDCYAELAVDDVFFQEDIVNGRFIKALFRFRKFEGPNAERVFGAYAQTKLLLFPPATPEAEQGGIDELEKGFDATVLSFAAALNRSPIRSQH